MAQGAPCCCCCFSNNVRHLVLILTTLCISALFANLILFNITAVLDPELNPNLHPVPNMASIHAYTDWLANTRLKRSINETVEDVRDLASPTDQITQIIDREEEEDEGHPILPPTKEVKRQTPATVPPTKKTEKPKLVFFTNRPEVIETTSTALPETVENATTEKNVVMEEVARALEKLKKEEEQEFDDKDRMSSVPPVDKVERDSANPTVTATDSNFLFRTLLYSSAGLGCFLGLVPSLLLLGRWGPRKTYTLVMLLSALFTILIPFAVKFQLGFYALFPLRLLQGFCFSASLPLAGSLTTNWGTLREQLYFISVVMLFIPVGLVSSWPFTALLHSNDVPMMVIYSIHAGITAVLAIMFLIFYRDRPQYHAWVNGLELNKIVAGKVQELKNNRVTTSPMSTVLRSLSAWSIWLAAFGFFSIITLFVTYLPAFFTCQEVFLVDYIGNYAALPFISLPFIYILSGLLNKLSCFSSTVHVRVFNSISFVLTAVIVFLTPLLFIGDDKHAVGKILLAASLAPLGLIISGFLRSITLVGRHYAQQIISMMGLSLSLSLVVVPLLVSFIVSNNNLAEWSKVFIAVAGMLAVSGVVFAIFGRGRSATWAESSWDPLVKTKMRNCELIDFSQDECGLYEMRLIGPQK